MSDPLIILGGFAWGGLFSLAWMHIVAYRYAEPMSRKWIALSLFGAIPAAASWLVIVALAMVAQ